MSPTSPKQPSTTVQTITDRLIQDDPHQYFMGEAIKAAKHNPSYPFGAVLVNCKTGEIVATGFNKSSENPTLHGEMDAINNYITNHPEHNFEDFALYTTGEPCPMCMAAILKVGIKKVYYGASIPFLETIMSQIEMRAEAIIQKSSPTSTTIQGGILKEACEALFKKQTPSSTITPTSSSLTKNNHAYYMKEAITIAKNNKAYPFGVVMVDNRTGNIVASGFDQRDKNPIRSAVLDALFKYVEHQPTAVDFNHLSVYTTAEPDVMSMSAMLWAGIPQCLFGISLDEVRKYCINEPDISAEMIIEKTPFVDATIQGGILKKECEALFRHRA